jgi:four helix bundle protein
MAGIARFEEIDGWKLSRELTNKVYALTQQEVFSRDFGLRDQIRRAAVSVMSNIAEGFESRTDSQFLNFLGMARAAAGEVRSSQLYIALARSTSPMSSSGVLSAWLNKVPKKSPVLSPTSRITPANVAYQRSTLSMKLNRLSTFNLRHSFPDLRLSTFFDL